MDKTQVKERDFESQLRKDAEAPRRRQQERDTELLAGETAAALMPILTRTLAELDAAGLTMNNLNHFYEAVARGKR